MGNLLAAPVTDKDTHSGRIEDEDIDFAVSSMQGWRVHMEDAHIAEPKLYATLEDNSTIKLPGHALFAVFDGHGGTYAAFYAGRNFCRVLSKQPKFVEYAKFVQERPTKESTLKEAEKVTYVRSGLELLEAALRDAFVECDKEIGLALQGNPCADANQPYHPDQVFSDDEDDDNNNDNGEGKDRRHALGDINDQGDSGTTACMVLLTPDWMICANAGDSRSVCSKAGHKAVPLSYDHKPDDEEEERRIRAAGGYVAGGRVEGDLAVSRGLGDYRFKSMNTVLAGAYPPSSSSSSAEQQDDGAEMTIMSPGDQKVSSIPDIIVQNRNKETDEFIIVACDGIWDVQSNHECVSEVATLFSEGESNVGLLCEEVSELLLVQRIIILRK